MDYWAIRSPDRIAIYDDEKKITFGELERRASSLAAALKRQGLKSQDFIMVFMPNGIDFVTVFYAGMKLGVHMAFANSLFKESEIEQMLGRIHPVYVIVSDKDRMEIVRNAGLQAPVLMASKDSSEYKEMIQCGEYIPGYSQDEDSSCVAITTSGSTGRMKFVARSYKSQIITAFEVMRAHRLKQDDVALIPLPLAQQFGMIALITCVISGCSIVLPSRFRAENVFELIERRRVTMQFGVPTIYAKEIEQYEEMKDKPDLSSLRVGMLGGAACSSVIIDWFEQNTGCRLLNCYGLTETAVLSIADYDDPEELRHNTSGKLLPYTSIEVIDDNGNVLPRGEKGEITCKSPCLMLGYIGDKDLTQRVLNDEGRFFSGDIGILDENNCLIISGRKKI